MTFSITIMFIALLALIQVPMTFAVGIVRARTGIRFLDGGNELLTRRMRAHGNFTETVPITLLAMGGAEYLGAAPALLWAGGGLLFVGRLAHAIDMYRTGWGIGRGIGMIATFVSMLLFSGVCLASLGGWLG